MAHDVFVSYASGDKIVADAACAMLESHGIRCWIAPRDVLPGIHYGEAIIDAIHECRIMVLVFSAKANLSPHIPKEIERAVSGGVTVMPLRIEDVAPAKSLDYFIGSVHWLDALTPPLEAHLQRLAVNVQTMLSRREPSAGSAHATPAIAARAAVPAPAVKHVVPPPARPTWPYAVIGGLIAIVAILGFVMMRSRSQGTAPVAPVAASMPATQTSVQPVAVPADVKKVTSSAMPAPTPAQPAQLNKIATSAVASPMTSPVKSPATSSSSSPPAAAIPVASHLREVALRYISDSSVKVDQLIGDEDKQTHKPTASQTFTRYGIEGADLGASFEHQGRAYFLFGPTLGRLPRDFDTVATTDAANPEGGVRLDFVTSAGEYVTVQPSGVNMGLFDVPVSGVSLGGQMYVAVSTNFTKGMATDRSVLTKFVAPATFQTLRPISQLPDGRFIRMSMHAEPGPIAGLPTGGPFILTWGTGIYRESDSYLSITPAAEIESGKGTRYFAGLDAANAPTWSDKESDAKPVMKDGTLGDVSVTWSKDLGVWLMTYDRRTMPNGIAFSYSRTPWGPWSEPQILFNAMRDGAYGKFIHAPRPKRDDGLEGPVMGPRNQSNAAEIRGGAFAPYVVERWTKMLGSELDIYYVISTINPYVVVLMKSRLQIE